MRKTGIAAIKSNMARETLMKQQGEELEEVKLRQVQAEMEKFTTSLQEFALKHQALINKNPAFRKQFNDMCKAVGVDPLNCYQTNPKCFLIKIASKGFWANILGVGDFYYSLGIQIIEICIQTRDLNGGLIEMGTLLKLLREKRGKTAEAISGYDVERAFQKINILGNSFCILSFGGRQFIQSVPRELHEDQTKLLGYAQTVGYVTVSLLQKEFGWDSERISVVLTGMLTEGITWVDTQAPVEPQYWFPSAVFRVDETN